MSAVVETGVAIGGPRQFNQFVNFAVDYGRKARPFSAVGDAAEAMAGWSVGPAGARASEVLDAAIVRAYRRGQIERAGVAIAQFMADNYDPADDDKWHREFLVESACIAAASATAAEDGDFSTLITPEDIIDLIGKHISIDSRDEALWLARQALNDFHVAWREPTAEEDQEVAEELDSLERWLSVCANTNEASPTNPQSEPRAVDYCTKTFELDNEPGLLGDIARWSQTFAFRPVLDFAQPAALATLAALFGRRWATPTGLGLNLYIVAIGETGGGKDALLGAPKKLLADAGFRHLIGPGDFSSDAAIEKSLRARPSQLMPLDEFGKLAQAMMGRNAPSFARLAAKALLEVYPRSAPGSEWSGKQRASDDRDCAAEPIHSPTLSLLGVSTPEGFFEGMSQQTLDDGFLNRLTVVRAGKAGARQRDPARMTPPPTLIDAMRHAYEESAATGNLADAASRFANATPVIRFARWADDEAIAAIEIVETWEDDASEAGRRGVAGRAAEQTQKIATLRALARNPCDPEVTSADIHWAFAMVRASIETIEDGAREMMAGSEFEEIVKDVERAVAAAGDEGMKWSDLLRAKGVGKRDDRAVESAVKRLEATERVWVTMGGRGGRRVRHRRPDERTD